LEKPALNGGLFFASSGVARPTDSVENQARQPLSLKYHIDGIAQFGRLQ
jgi:hypothetical protein